jgi:hypothetical protein
MTKVYLATSGEYSDFTVRHAFAREEDARSYLLADDVMELLRPASMYVPGERKEWQA